MTFEVFSKNELLPKVKNRTARLYWKRTANSIAVSNRMTVTATVGNVFDAMRRCYIC